LRGVFVGFDEFLKYSEPLGQRSNIMGTFYYVRNHRALDNHLLLHLNNALAPSSATTIKSILDYTQDWFIQYPEIGERLYCELVEHIGEDYVAWERLQSDETTDRYLYGALPVRPELDELRRYFVESLALYSSVNDVLIKRILARSIMLPSDALVYDERNERFRLSHPLITPTDITDWEANDSTVLDLPDAHRYRFYYGPTPKEVLNAATWLKRHHRSWPLSERSISSAAYLQVESVLTAVVITAALEVGASGLVAVPLNTDDATVETLRAEFQRRNAVFHEQTDLAQLPLPSLSPDLSLTGVTLERAVRLCLRDSLPVSFSGGDGMAVTVAPGSMIVEIETKRPLSTTPFIADALGVTVAVPADGILS